MENKVLKVLKPVSRVVSLLSVGLSVLAIIFLVAYNFADVFTIITDEGTKYAEGFSYPGFQSIFFGYGNMIIQGYTEANFSILMFLGFFLPLAGCIVCSVMLLTNLLRKGTNIKKAILEGVVGVFLIFGAIVLFNCDKIWIANAKSVTDSYTNYYEVYLLPAMNGEIYFAKDQFPDIVFGVCLGVGIFKLVHVCMLLFQKYYARYVNKQSFQIKEEGENANESKE